MNTNLICATLMLTLMGAHVTGIRHSLYGVMNNGPHFVLNRSASLESPLIHVETQVTPAAELKHASAVSEEGISKVPYSDPPLKHVSAVLEEGISRVPDSNPPLKHASAVSGEGVSKVPDSDPPPDVHEVSLVQQPNKASPRDASRHSWPSCKVDGAGKALGCRAHCNCGWGQQCYPKWTPLEDGKEHLTTEPNTGAVRAAYDQEALYGEDEGICETAVPVLALASFIIFSLVLVVFIALRTFFQWWSSFDMGFIKPVIQRSTRKSLTPPGNGGLAAAEKCAVSVKAEGTASQSGFIVGGAAESDSSDSEEQSEDWDPNLEPVAANSPNKEEGDASSSQKR